LEFIKELKNVKRSRISEYTAKYTSAVYHIGKTPWAEKCHLAFPCATQNELDKNAAISLISNGCFCVTEGANMPCTID
ncbi:glutamate dehydrogenase, partial [Saccharophagus degradans]|nr:glutamate dehydrogenase [Saccharophagus degradans]